MDVSDPDDYNTWWASAAFHQQETQDYLHLQVSVWVAAG